MASPLDQQLILRPYSVGTSAPAPLSTAVVQERRSRILIFEEKLRLSRAQAATIDEAMRTTQFICPDTSGRFLDPPAERINTARINVGAGLRR